ncbi:MAG: hypothetical protein KME60_25580 [Cyanomargarita calcarea GSE-NOS-MK-12-04C]|jgi:hypothetical protein|uniref:TonB C-terminal domain-containing protein n=1 Tax=Cyanomargarita calcarea GSE-NOS-MK-12-04C TaxID=2839659 RepID=A0A951QQM0_9CYAN|nr:hypothetical protein [Cyanomargarita calcarea GSE-NOS-MK-12-04C]
MDATYTKTGTVYCGFPNGTTNNSKLGMAHSLGDKTQEYAKVWRRHTDPPGLWFAIAIVSVALHLLLFWLMRSYSFSLSRQNQSPIPLEIIEISPRRQSRAKPKPKTRTTVLAQPVTPNVTSTRQKSRVAPLPKQLPQKNLTAKPALRNLDRNELAFPSRTEGKRPIGIEEAQQRQQQLIEQQRQQRQQQRREQQLAEQERLSQLAQQQQLREQELAQQQQLREQELAQQQQLREQELAQQQQLREQELAQQQQLREQELDEQKRQQRREQELAEQEQRREQELAEQKRQQELDDQENSDPLDAPRTGTGDAPRTENGGTAQTPPTKPSGGLLATWSPLTPEQQAIRMGGDLSTILKDMQLPKLAGRAGQESNSITIPATSKLQPGTFIFSLVIEENGRCSDARLQDKNMPSADKKIYEQFGVEEICQKYIFVPAQKLSLPKPIPIPSNLFVSITIEQKAP